MGVIQFERGELEAAAANFRTALELSRGQSLVEAEALNYFRLGVVNLQVDDLRSADDCFREASYLCRPGSEGRFESLIYRALTAHRAGRADDARHYLEHSVNKRRSNEPSIEVTGRRSLAATYFDYLSREYEPDVDATIGLHHRESASVPSARLPDDEPAAWQLSTIGWFSDDT
jgi:tetratricopeptide (TPR) repeat protein